MALYRIRKFVIRLFVCVSVFETVKLSRDLCSMMNFAWIQNWSACRSNTRKPWKDFWLERTFTWFEHSVWLCTCALKQFDMIFMEIKNGSWLSIDRVTDRHTHTHNCKRNDNERLKNIRTDLHVFNQFIIDTWSNGNYQHFYEMIRLSSDWIFITSSRFVRKSIFVLSTSNHC